MCLLSKIHIYINSGGNIWTSDGCKLDTALSNETHIACKCTHLTNFAVLMDVFEIQVRICFIKTNNENNNNDICKIKKNALFFFLI